MNNISNWTKSFAETYERVNPFSIISVEEQVNWQIQCAKAKLDEAKSSSCCGLAKLTLQSAARSLTIADTAEPNELQTKELIQLDQMFQAVCLKWGI